MVIINKHKAENYLLIDILYELNQVKDHIQLFENKYNSSFKTFEDHLQNQSEEDTEKWDDYIEWKAYEKTKEHLLKQKLDIEHGNYQFAE